MKARTRRWPSSPKLYGACSTTAGPSNRGREDGHAAGTATPAVCPPYRLQETLGLRESPSVPPKRDLHTVVATTSSGLRALDMQTANENGWKAFESGSLADWKQWLVRHPPDAADARAKADRPATSGCAATAAYQASAI